MTVCRSPAEAFAAGQADAANDPPLTQEQADLIAVILAPHGEQPPQPVAAPANRRGPR